MPFSNSYKTLLYREAARRRAATSALSANDEPRPQIEGQHRQVDQVDKERADDRHDDKGLGRRAVATGQRLNVGDRRRGGTHRKAAEGSRNDRALIVAPDQRKRHPSSPGGQRGLGGENDQQRPGQTE